MLKHSLTITMVALCAACTAERTPTTGSACYDYALEVQPVLERACLECHGPTLAEGDYSVATLAETLARRPADGTARIEANADTLFLVAARGELAGHPAAETADVALFERWLVECQAGTLRTEGVHARGWINRASADFHGAALETSGWDFDACGDCHGAPDDEGGGKAGIACTTCHTGGPTACATCHGVAASDGAPGPALDGSIETTARGVGAHRIHVAGRLLAASVECEDCHVVPENWDDPGHIFTADGAIDESPAEVMFGAAAGRSLEYLEARRAGPPSYDAAAGTCDNIYCHAAVVGDTTYSAPVWTEISAAPACDTCHGLPPGGTHPELTDCVRCHPLAIGAETGADTFEIVNDSLHIDGKVSLGDGGYDCSLCHGSPASSAPPQGLGGETSTDSPQVGAHQAHLGANVFRGPIPCTDCHRVPTGADFVGAVLAPGHIDSAPPAEVFSAGQGLATADGANASYARPNCTNTYCHGGGAAGSTDTTAGVLRTLDWTDVGNSTVVCGACHGLPPQSPRHAQQLEGVPLTISDCALCHGGSVDPSGTILFDSNGHSTHIDGRVSP